MTHIASILETVMLLCFGCSWPLNLIKNYKAATAKAMSLGFIVLIDSGYVAGIAAKIITLSQGGTVPWYVLAVYVFNLLMVTLNLFVYFRNKKLDNAKK